MISFSDHEEMPPFWVNGWLHPEASRVGLAGFKGECNRRVQSAPWQCRSGSSSASGIPDGGRCRTEDGIEEDEQELQAADWVEEAIQSDSFRNTCSRNFLLDGHLSLEMFVYCCCHCLAIQVCLSQMQLCLVQLSISECMQFTVKFRHFQFRQKTTTSSVIGLFC